MKTAQRPQSLGNPAPVDSQNWGDSIYLGVGRGASTSNGAQGSASSHGGGHA
jgi:hypothetical protein